MKEKSYNMHNEPPRIFISHSSADSDFVDWLADGLTSFGLPIWYDKWEIMVGDSIVRKINEGLKTADYLAVVLSRASVMSRWVQEELNAATMSMIESEGVYVLPLLIEDCEIPPLLRHLRYADFRLDRDDALREVLEAVMPEKELQLTLDEIYKQIKILLKEFDPLASGAERIIVDMDDRLQRLVDIRYRFEKRMCGESPLSTDDFFKKLEFLERAGIQTRSSAWSLVHSLRNRFFHASSRESHLLKGKLKRISGCKRELDRIASRIRRIGRSAC